MSVEELLNDDMFKTNQGPPVDHFNECSQYYIRGEFKTCLETLFQYGLIETEKGQILFNDACDGIKQFNILGVSLQPFLDKSFSEIHWDEYMHKNGIQDLNKYLRNSYKWIQWRGKTEDSLVKETFKQFVEDVLDKTLNGNNSVEEIYELFKFYLEKVQISLLHQHKSMKLYERLCEKYPTLSSTLQQESILGPTYEERLTDVLRVHKKKPIAVIKPEPIAEPINTPGNRQNTTANRTTDEIIQQYKRLARHYITLLYRSRYKNIITVGIIFSFILLYKLSKWTQRKGPATIRWISKWANALDQY
ncbi:hypothetical protein MOUN0_G06898 [Monosporozyma unispora]|nr:hypothetical protein C6P44_004748 [Kazachstania unispora]